MHGHAMSHGDIKPENILRAAGAAPKGGRVLRYVICDLGSAKQYGEAGETEAALETSTIGKTHAFFSPEMCGASASSDSWSSDSVSASASSFSASYSPFQADVWAAGVTLFAVSSGRLPFWDERGGQPLFDAILSQKLQHAKTLRPELCTLLDQMLNRSGARPGISELQQHPWVVDKGSGY